jgi:hypothetical protein
VRKERAMSDINIREILKGMKPGRMQTVGIMQVIPLTMDEELWDSGYADPSQLDFSSSSYGSMTFKNDSDKPAIVPSHMGYVVPKKAAQDHAMATAGYIGAKKSKTYANAMCIQQSQGGHFQAGKYDMLVLPYSLREAALEKRKERSYDKLWGDIASFNSSLSVDGGRGGHLEYFLKHYSNELDQFIAEFECVPKQCGALILIDGDLVGVERSPHPKYWRSIWSALIRECYGSYAILARKKYGDKLPDIKVKDIIRKMLDDAFESSEEKVGDRKMLTLKNAQFMGQVLRDGSKIVYSSLFTTQDWLKNRVWNEAEAFDI